MTILNLLFFPILLVVGSTMEPNSLPDPDFCRLPEHCNLLMARPDIIFCPSCGGRNWYH